MGRRRVVVLGIDGFPFQLLEEVEKDERLLPSLRAVMEEGGWGELESTIPYTTFPAWASMVTGVPPGRHGVYDFLYLDRGRNLRTVRGSDCRATPVWRRLQEEGMRSIVVNVPPYHPAEPIDSVMIASFPHPKISVHPPKLEEKIREMGYVVDVDDVVNKIKRNRAGTIRDLLHAAERRARVAEYLLDRYDWDFFMIVFNVLDRLLHYTPLTELRGMFSEEKPSLLGRILRGGRVSQLVREMFRVVDDFLSHCLDRIGREGTLIVASDHGMETRPRVFLVNDWLRSEGYIHYMETKALCYSTVMPVGLIRLNVEGRELKGVIAPSRYDVVVEELSSRLLGMRDEETRRRIVKRVWRGEELYGSDAVGATPDLVFEVEEGYTVNPWRLEERNFTEAKRICDHKRAGIFVIYGDEGRYPDKLPIEEIHGAILRGFELGSETSSAR